MTAGLRSLARLLRGEDPRPRRAVVAVGELVDSQSKRVKYVEHRPGSRAMVAAAVATVVTAPQPPESAIDVRLAALARDEVRQSYAARLLIL